MRTHLLFAALLLPGCAQLSGKPEGDWLLTIDETSVMCNGEAETDLDEPFQSTGATYVLRDGTFVFSVDEILLKGEATREGFTLSYENGTTFSDPNCTKYVQNSAATFRGSFGDDMAMGGRLEFRQVEAATDCYNQNTEDTCTYVYNIQGILLQSTRQDHLDATGGSIGGYF